MRDLSVRCAAGVALLLLCGAPVLAQAIDAKPQTLLINRHAIAVNARTHHLYAVDQENDRILAVDCATERAVSIPVGKEPDALAVDDQTNRVYVVNVGSASVSVIDGAQNTVTATVAMGNAPYSIAIDAELNRIYVSNTYSNNLTVIDGATNKAQYLRTGSKDVIGVDTRRHRLVMFGYESPTIQVMDEKTQHLSTMQAVPHLWGLAIDPRSGAFYVPEIGDKALFVEGKPAILVGAIPDAVAIDPLRNRVFVANYGTGASPGTVSEIDAAQGKVIATIAVGIRPQALAIDERRGLVYVANAHGDTVTVIEEDAGKVLATLPGGHTPYALALDPETGAVFTANYGAHPYTRLNNAALLRSSETEKKGQ